MSEPYLFYKVSIPLSINYPPSASALLRTRLSNTHATTATTNRAIHVRYKWKNTGDCSPSNLRSAILCSSHGSTAIIPIRRSCIPNCTILRLRVWGILSPCGSVWAKYSYCSGLFERERRRRRRKRWKSRCLVRRGNEEAEAPRRGAS